MPELPEVETIRRRLKTQLCEKEVCAVDVRCARLRSAVPEGLTAFLHHARVSAVERKGKVLIVHLNRGAWLVHLGMSGRFLFGEPRNARDARHDHLILRLSGSVTVRYNDFRRFGSFAICPTGALANHPVLARLGVDALSGELSGEAISALLRNRTAPIKTSLLDQGVICGLGNIYATEILYWSDIHPMRPSCSLTRRETHKLSSAMHKVLWAAIDAGGSTLPDYVGTSGALGNFQDQFAVFGRNGLACPRCDAPCVSREVWRGRSTYYCGRYQQ
jgi:formamidopyrimidine-DNA glycosylase